MTCSKTICSILPCLSEWKFYSGQNEFQFFSWIWLLYLCTRYIPQPRPGHFPNSSSSCFPFTPNFTKSGFRGTCIWVSNNCRKSILPWESQMAISTADSKQFLKSLHPVLHYSFAFFVNWMSVKNKKWLHAEWTSTYLDQWASKQCRALYAEPSSVQRKTVDVKSQLVKASYISETYIAMSQNPTEMKDQTSICCTLNQHCQYQLQFTFEARCTVSLPL